MYFFMIGEVISYLQTPLKTTWSMLYLRPKPDEVHREYGTGGRGRARDPALELQFPGKMYKKGFPECFEQSCASEVTDLATSEVDMTVSGSRVARWK